MPFGLAGELHPSSGMISFYAILEARWPLPKLVRIRSDIAVTSVYRPSSLIRKVDPE